MLSTSYRVEIAQLVGTGDAAGFVDPTRVENYVAQEEDGEFGTFEQHTDKERANYRYKAMIQSLQSMGNLYVSDVEVPGGSAATPPSTLVFTLEAERGDGMLITHDEENEGEELFEVEAIKRCIARALIQGRQNLTCDIYDSTSTTGPQNGSTSTSIARRGPRVMTINIDPLSTSLSTIENAVTVTKL